MADWPVTQTWFRRKNGVVHLGGDRELRIHLSDPARFPGYRLFRVLRGQGIRIAAALRKLPTTDIRGELARYICSWAMSVYQLSKGNAHLSRIMLLMGRIFP